MVETTDVAFDGTESMCAFARARLMSRRSDEVVALVRDSHHRAALTAYTHRMATAALRRACESEDPDEDLQRAVIWSAMRPDGMLEWSRLNGVPGLSGPGFRRLSEEITSSFARVVRAMREGRQI